MGVATVGLFLALPAVAQADGVVDRVRIDPHGRVAGLYLRDGTVIDATPSRGPSVQQAVRPGDTVRVTYTAEGQAMLFDRRTSQFVNLGPAGPTARGGGPRATGPVTEYALVDDAMRLSAVTVQGRVTEVTHTQHGVPTGFLLDDGSQVSVVPDVAGVLDSVRPGDVLRVDGRGTRTPQGTSLWAVVITTSDHGAILDMTRGVGAPELGFRP
jgi:hypothetical protein